MVISKAEKNEKLALNISLLADLLFVFVEVIVAITTKSRAFLMDSVYDAAELLRVLLSIRRGPFCINLSVIEDFMVILRLNHYLLRLKGLCYPLLR